MNKFAIKMLNDFRKIYDNAEIIENRLKITRGFVEVQLAVSDVYRDYLHNKDYKLLIKEYSNNIDELLNQNAYSINYDIVFPVVRKINQFEESLFYSMPLFEDLAIYFVEDAEVMFRFISKNDKVDFDILKEKSFGNLNELVNPLSRLHEGLEVYCLKFNSDLASSMFMNKSVERNIIKLFGLNFTFVISSASTLLIAPNTPQYVAILRELINTDDDPNIISDKIIEFNKGMYKYVEQ